MDTQTTQDSAENFFKSGKEQLDGVMRTGAQAARKGFEQSVETVKKQFDDAVRNYDEVAAFGRENVDACIEASTAATKAAESINSELFALTRKACDSNLAAVKSLAGAKSPKEFFDIQSDLVKSGYEEVVSSVNRINGLFAAAVNEAFSPVGTRFAATAERMSKSFA